MNWPLRWDLLMRYRLIEVVAFWEGRLTTNHLCNSFGIGRQQASKDINTYLREIAPGNLIYDKRLKGYRPSDFFEPRLTTGIADEYLHVLSRNKDISHTFEGLDLGLTSTEILHTPLRKVEPSILRSIVLAIRDKSRVELSYTSMNNPDGECRVIAPHTLVCTPLRWHVRAYCEKNGEFRDFVLSRFTGQPELIGESDKTFQDDDAWNTEVTIQLSPDPRLNNAQKKFVTQDYGMESGLLEIKTKGPLVQYLLQALNLDPKKVEAKASAQQIIITNLEELEPYLF